MVILSNEKTASQILIVDDHPVMRDGLRARISSEPGLAVCGESESVDGALQLVRSLRPDLVIVDLTLRNGRGIDLIRQIREFDANLKTMVLSTHEERLFGEAALRAGARGYIQKSRCRNNLCHAIRTILNGDWYVSAELEQKLLGQSLIRNKDLDSDPIHSLSKREREVFKLIGEGLTSSAIAANLKLSIHTIDTYREKIRHKLNADNSCEVRQQAVQWLLENRGTLE